MLRPIYCLAICLALALVSSASSSSFAQPRIKLLEPYKKAIGPTYANIPVLLTNTGDLPLIIASTKLVQKSNYFSVTAGTLFPKIVEPRETTYVQVDFNASFEFEYGCDVLIASNDLLEPIATAHLRVNDSIPPYPVKNVRLTPMKGGNLHIQWSAPPPSRDGDTLVDYEIYSVRPENGNKSELLGITRDTSWQCRPAGEGIVYLTIATRDDMGNRAVLIDTLWTDSKPPDVGFAHLDSMTYDLPEHIEQGDPKITLHAKDDHLSYVRLSWRDTAAGSTPTTIRERWGPIGVPFEFQTDWRNFAERGMKQLEIYARDSVGNDTTITRRFQITQARGWPRYIREGVVQPSSPVLMKDQDGWFLVAGSNPSVGEFRTDGSIMFQYWPLNMVRSTSDAMIPTVVNDDPLHGSRAIIGSSDNQAQLFTHEGRFAASFGNLGYDSRVISEVQFGGGSGILAGHSPILVQDGGIIRTAGVRQSWLSTIDTLVTQPLVADTGVREPDRFVVGDLDRNGAERVVRIHDAGASSGEQIEVYDVHGSMMPGWPRTLWHPSGSYEGIYPSLGDINGDGKLEIVVPLPNDTLWAFHADGSVVSGYPVHLGTETSGRNQALIVDINGDSAGDIIFPTQDSIQAINGRTGQPLGGFWPIRRHLDGNAYLTAADFHGLGMVEIIEAPHISSPGKGAWVYVYAPGIRNYPGTIQWGTYQHDQLRTGNYDTWSRDLQSGVGKPVTCDTQGLSVYPNPASGMVHIHSHADEKPVEIIDALGRVVTSMISSNGGWELDVKALAPGSYFVRAEKTMVPLVVVR